MKIGPNPLLSGITQFTNTSIITAFVSYRRGSGTTRSLIMALNWSKSNLAGGADLMTVSLPVMAISYPHGVPFTLGAVAGGEFIHDVPNAPPRLDRTCPSPPELPAVSRMRCAWIAWLVLTLPVPAVVRVIFAADFAVSEMFPVPVEVVVLIAISPNCVRIVFPFTSIDFFNWTSPSLPFMDKKSSITPAL